MVTQTKKLFASLFASALLFAGLASPAAAHQNQTGLVNVAVEDVNVVVPIQVAANICGVNVIALSADVDADGSATCTNRQGQTVTITEHTH